MKQLTKYFKPYLWWLLVLVVFVAGQAYANLTLPDYTAEIVDKGIFVKDLAAVWGYGFKMLLITLFGGLCTIAVGFVAAKIATGYSRRMREAIFKRVEQFSLSEFNNFSSSSLVTRATNDLQQVQNVFWMVLRLAFLAPFMAVGSIIKAHQLAPGMSWIVFVAIGVMFALVIVLFFLAIPKFRQIQELVDKLSLQTRQMLTGVRVIRAFNNDAREQAKFNKINLESTRLNIFVNRLMTLMLPVMTLVLGLASLGVVWVGSYIVGRGQLQVGSLLALIQYVAQTIMSFLMISIIFIRVPRAAVSARRVNEVLETEPSIVDPVEPRHLPRPLKGTIEFRKVNFAYKGSEQPVLTDISFKAEPGQTTAIIGGTGSGKSTILNLIPRLYDVTAGQVLVDGIDVRHLPQAELRQQIGYVPQKASLFSGTVASNIAYGQPQADQNQLTAAAKTAQASGFIDSLPEGVDSPIAQAGSNVSGGQKQRLSIARALAKRPPIYLFDDSFSALDFKTDAALRRALDKAVNGATLIIVAQRISTIMQAEKIIVLDDGRIVGTGTHQELLKSSKVYREIAESQLSESELRLPVAKRKGAKRG